MLSIRFDSNESTRIVSLGVDSFYRKSICEIFRKYSFPGLYRVGWKCCRFDSIRSNRHESFPLLSIRYAGSRFARDLENIASRVYTGWVENVVESTRIVSPAVDSLCRKSICEIFRKYSFPGLYRVGWKCCRIDTNRFPCCRFVMPEVDLRESLKLQLPGSIQGGLKMLSIRFDSNESTRIVSLAVELLYRKSICEIFRKYSFPGLYRVGWKCCRFDSIRSNRHESFPLLSIHYAGSRFARDLENIASRVYTGWVENVVESTRIVSPAVDSLCRKSICASLWNFSFPGLYRVGWKCCRFDSIWTNRHKSFPLLSSCYTGSRFARYLENIASRVYTGWVENVVDSTRFDRIYQEYRLPAKRFGFTRFDSQWIDRIDSNRITSHPPYLYTRNIDFRWNDSALQGSIRNESIESTRIA